MSQLRHLLALLVATSTASGCMTEFDESLLDGAGCSGCHDGIRCQPGNDAVACGKNGAVCQTCAAPAALCEDGSCVVDAAVRTLSVGLGHVLAVDRLGRLWGWGANLSDALGVPVGPSSDEPVLAGEGVSWWSAMATGADPALFSCAIDVDANLWCWGANGDGQLGFGDKEFRSQPEQHDQKQWSEVDAGLAHTCALDDAGVLHCWGWGNQGRLGFGPNTSTEVPTQVIDTLGNHGLSVGDVHGCMITESSAISCWGENPDGQLGHATGIEPAPITPSTSWARVSAGGSHTCAIRQDGSLYCWGDNAHGQLGLSASAPNAPTRVDESSDWKQVSAAREHTCALKNDGSLWCWGANDRGQIGDPAAPHPAPITRVGTRSDWQRVVTSTWTTCAIASDGTVWCWGENGYGQAGSGGNPVAMPMLMPFP